MILAVPHGNADDARAEVKSYVDGKTVIDVMNALGPNISCTTSTAEENTDEVAVDVCCESFQHVFAPNLSTAKIPDQQLTAFIARDNDEAKRTVMKLTRDMGFDPVDCGPLKMARSLEIMGNMLINLAFTYGMGNKIGYKLVKA